MKILFLILTIGLLGACQTTADPELRVKGENYSVILGDDEHEGTFCPPGQAKKGRC